MLLQGVIPHLLSLESANKYMLKALKETPDEFSDLSIISHADVDDSVDVCRKLI
jgi:hypothetical protein